MIFPRLYAIADSGVLALREVSVEAFAEALRGAGVTLLQYRDKNAGPQTVLRNAAVIAEAFAGSGAALIMNDRVDLAVLAGWDGVHVGQGDLSPEDAKAVLAGARMPTLREGRERDERGTRVGGDDWSPEAVDPTHAIRPHGWGTRSVAVFGTTFDRIVGVSTHTEAQMVAADAGCSDYVAIGPVFATGTKLDAAAVVGLEGVRRARALTGKPLVAIGGITRENARSVIEAGADSVAVISGLFVGGKSVEKVARDFLLRLG